MSLEISALEANALKFKGALLRRGSRSPIPLLDPNKDRTHHFLTMCSWCQPILRPEEQWVKVEVAVLQLGLFDSLACPQLTHGLCSNCLNKVSS